MNKVALLFTLLALSGCARQAPKPPREAVAAMPWQIALDTLGPDFQREATSLNITQRMSGNAENPDYATVTLEQLNMLDDSVSAEKTDFRLRKHNHQWLIISQVKSVKCRVGRGQQNYATTPCR